jgi:glyoxylase-like metal-dependent hydrolase (beta-lactamase superfamily II)
LLRSELAALLLSDWTLGGLMRLWIVAVGLVLLAGSVPGHAQEYEILAVQYGSVPGFPLRGLLPDAAPEETIEIAMAIWVIRDADRTILFDTGFFRVEWLDRFEVRGFVRPDRALSRIQVTPEDVTDIVISHAHWDHMGGVELFPNATVWIQEEEYTYYTGAAWQPGGNSGGIDPADVAHLVERNTAGLVRLVQGDGVEILPGITVFTGARHTYASQYLMVEGDPAYVLASDNAYLYRNLTEARAGATYQPEDREANLSALRRMLELVGDPSRVVPGHDLEQFRRFPRVAEGVVRIRP